MNSSSLVPITPMPPMPLALPAQGGSHRAISNHGPITDNNPAAASLPAFILKLLQTVQNLQDENARLKLLQPLQPAPLLALPERPRIPIERLLDQAELDYRARRKAQPFYKSMGKLWRRTLEGMHADEVTTAWLDEWVLTCLAEGAAPATIASRLSFLSRAFKLGMRRGLCANNPAHGVDYPKVSGRRKGLLSESQEQQLAGAMSETDFKIVRLALITGLRLSELFGLHSSCIDRDGGWVDIPITKTGRERTLPLTEEFRAILRHFPGNGFPIANRIQDEFDAAHCGRPKARTSQDLPKAWTGFWVSNTARAWTYCRFKPAVREIGLPPAFSFHQLRHTWASRASMAGIPPRTIQTLAGWETAGMLTRYGHLTSPHLRESAEKLSQIGGGIGGGKQG